MWGSLHALRIIKGGYDQAKLSALAGFQGVVDHRKANNCVYAGWYLLSYLSLRWAPRLIDPADVAALKVEVWRQTLTVGLMADRQSPDSVGDRIIRVMEAFSDDRDPYLCFLTRIFQTCLEPKRQADPGRIKGIVEEVQSSFALARSTGMGEISGLTWAALAHRGLPSDVGPQVCFEVWEWMAGVLGRDHFVKPGDPGTGDPDPAEVGAAWFVFKYYDYLSARTHPDWRDGPDGRKGYAAQLAGLWQPPPRPGAGFRLR